MKRRLYILLLLLPLQIAAQNIVPVEKMLQTHSRYSGGYTPEFNSYCKLTKPTKIDKSYLRVTYDMLSIVDRSSQEVVKDRVVALIGKDYYKCYSQYLWQLSMNHTVDPTAEQRAQQGWMKGCKALLTSAIYREIKSSTICNRAMFPFTNDLVYEYSEPTPKLNWSFVAENKEIEGYSCNKATTTFAGREWVVWYTPSIPVDGGLWKFNGLPGLILEAYDTTGEHRFVAIGIEKSVEDIIRYTVPTKKLSREAFFKAERKTYAHPLDAMFASLGQNYYVSFRNGKTEVITQDDNVAMHYNPLELE